MFKTKKEKRYKLKNLYICAIYKITNIEPITTSEYDLIGSLQDIKILYHPFFHYINPLTKERFTSNKKENIGYIYVKPERKICDFFNIPDFIFLRGDYLTLEEVLEYSKQLKECVQMVRES